MCVLIHRCSIHTHAHSLAIRSVWEHSYYSKWDFCVHTSFVWFQTRLTTHTTPTPQHKHHKPTVDYRNNRAAYVAAFWAVVNWEFANENLAKAP